MLIRYQIHHSLRWPQRTFLERKEWLEVPWALCSTRRPPISHFNDICCPIPGLCEDLNHLRITATARELDERLHYLQVTSFIERASHQLEKIESSGKILMGMSPRASWPGLTDNDVTSFPQHLFGKPLQFTGLHGCADFIHYNYMCYTLSYLLRQARNELAIFDPTRVLSTHNTEGQRNPRHFADSICRCVPYMCNFALHGSAGAMMIQHVMIDIFPIYGLDTAESRWIVSLFQIFWRELGLEGGNNFLEKHLGRKTITDVSSTV